jgi:hypothetical protein
MTETTRCQHCGVQDALGRHDPTCSYALQIGLPRLAEGEEPIEPMDDDDPNESVAVSRVMEEEQGEPGPPSQATHALTGRIERNPDAGLYTGLWFAYADVDTPGFDVIVFGAEIDALRHAVAHGWHVAPLELGKSLHAQTRSEPPRASLPHDER